VKHATLLCAAGGAYAGGGALAIARREAEGRAAGARLAIKHALALFEPRSFGEASRNSRPL